MLHEETKNQLSKAKLHPANKCEEVNGKTITEILEWRTFQLQYSR